MNAKKVICIICCFILAFTLLSGPWRADAEAAGTAIAVGVGCAAIVGLFILAAGYDFETQSDFKVATEAFMNSDGVQYVSKINEFLLGTGTAFLELRRGNLAPIVTADWFPAFWNSITDFFSSGEVSGATSYAPSGMAYYNGVLLPDLPTSAEYDYLGKYSYGYYCWYLPIIFKAASGGYYLYYFSDQNFIYQASYSDRTNSTTGDSLEGWKHSCARFGSCRFYYNTSVGDWVESYFYEGNASGTTSLFLFDAPSGSTVWDVFWTPEDYYLVNTYNVSPFTKELYLSGSEPTLTLEGDVVGVFNDTPHAPSDVLPTLQAGTIDGSLEWDLSSSSVYQDLTQAGNIPLTSTQTGVLTDIDAVPQTAVKDEAIEEYRANGLTNVFPFCIPFDIYRFLSILVAEREAPHFEFQLDFGRVGAYDMEIDLSEFEEAVKVLRILELLAFCVGLAVLTSKVIKW